MKGLLQKDAPWMVALAVAGAVALGLVAAGHGFLHLFVMPPGRMEELFFTAASMGLFVGAFAGVWDDLLGTREFLQHRPISAAKLARAPIAAVLTVVLTWLALTPLLAWVFASFWSGVFLPTQWAGVPEILAAVGIAVPASAVGLAAAALPAPWWLRIVFGSALAAGSGVWISTASFGRGGASPAWYAATCVLAAAGMFALAAHAGTVRRDPDRAWPKRTLWPCGGAFVVAVGVLASAGAFEAQRAALSMLHRAYPELAVRDGQVVRYHRTADWAERQLVDEHHAPTERVPRATLTELVCRLPRDGQPLRLEAPTWHARGQSLHDWTHHREVLLDHDGQVWVWQQRDGRLERRLRAGDEPFPPTCRLDRLLDAASGADVVVLTDRDGGRLWRFEADGAQFEPMDLPGRDRFVRIGRVDREATEGAPLLLMQELMNGRKREDLYYVEGERGRYALRDGQWVAFAPPAPRAPAPDRVLTVGQDPICFAVEVSASAERPAFRSEFAPRTASEYLHATHASLWSLLRAPALQVVGFLRGHAPDGERQRATVFDDPLLRGRSRPWLLALCLAVAALSVWAVRRRLRAFGADAATQRFWTLAAASTGVAGALACGLCTRRRAFARPVITAPPPPRIRSVPLPEEVSS